MKNLFKRLIVTNAFAAALLLASNVQAMEVGITENKGPKIVHSTSLEEQFVDLCLKDDLRLEDARFTPEVIKRAFLITFDQTEIFQMLKYKRSLLKQLICSKISACIEKTHGLQTKDDLAPYLQLISALLNSKSFTPSGHDYERLEPKLQKLQRLSSKYFVTDEPDTQSEELKAPARSDTASAAPTDQVMAAADNTNADDTVQDTVLDQATLQEIPSHQTTATNTPAASRSVTPVNTGCGGCILQ